MAVAALSPGEGTQEEVVGGAGGGGGGGNKRCVDRGSTWQTPGSR